MELTGGQRKKGRIYLPSGKGENIFSSDVYLRPRTLIIQSLMKSVEKIISFHGQHVFELQSP